MRDCVVLFLVFSLLTSQMIIPVGADGIDGSSTTYSITKSSSSSVTGPSDSYDGSNSTDLRLVADTINGACFGAYAIITYQLFLNSSSNQNLSMTHYSQTNYQGIGQGWSTLTNLEMWVNVTDSNGNRQAWFSSSPDNQHSSTLTTSNLGKVFPYSNSSIELTIGIQHDSSFASESDCIGILEIYEIWSESEPIAPDISYNPNTFSFVKGVAIQDKVPINDGGEASSWSIYPQIPSGLQFSSVTGTISGTPSILSASETYTINATNDVAVNSTTITIEVIDDAPSILYNPNSLTLYQSVTISQHVPTNNGGDVVSWDIEPTVPDGLSFSTSTGTISGTPSTPQTSTQYTVTGENSGGNDSTSITIEIVGTPILSHSSSTFEFTKSQTISPIEPINSGGEADSWSISPELPQGLQLSSSTGIISGTPNSVSNQMFYTVNASNPAGHSQSVIQIEVVDIPPSISYQSSEYIFPANTSISSLIPTSTGGEVTSWSISPQLSNGLQFNTLNGEIYGTTTVSHGEQYYNITAINSQGQDTFEISISVVDGPVISLNSSSYTFVINQQILEVLPANIGSSGASWSISPSLPDGLVFATDTGKITGSPNSLMELSFYNITATNSYGSDTISISITIVDNPPEFSYESTAFIFNQGIDIGLISPTSTGGEITSWSIDCLLPIGIDFNGTNGQLSGTPVALSSSSCVVTAGNSGGSTNYSMNIEVIVAPPSLLEDTSIHTFTVDFSNYSVTISNTGGTATSWERLDTLPSGLQFSNGIISGTPLGKSELSQYRFKATNQAGSDTVSILIEVVHPPPIFNYPQEQYSFTTGQEITPVIPQLIQGSSNQWTISPPLPAGIEFNPNSGQISGTPAIESDATSYTVSATNDQGSWEESISISVIKNQVNNGDNGNGEESSNELSGENKDDETAPSEDYIWLIIAAVILALLVLIMRPKTEVYHYHTIEKQTVERRIEDFSTIEEPKPLDILAKHIVSNINENTNLDTPISELKSELKFDRNKRLKIHIDAARAYPSDSNLRMTKKEGLETFENALRELYSGPISGAKVTPCIGVYSNKDGENWDQSYLLEISEDPNFLLLDDNLRGYIKSIRKFIHTICKENLQTCVLFTVKGDSADQGDFNDQQNEQERATVEAYQETVGKYDYISTEELDNLILNFRKNYSADSEEE